METYQNLNGLIKYYESKSKEIQENIKDTFTEMEDARSIDEQTDAQETLSLLHSRLSHSRSVAHYLKSYQQLVK